VIGKTPEQLFEDGYVEIVLGAFLLRKEGKYQEAYDELGHIISLLAEDRQELRKMYKVNP
jgi:hypothetical protein